MTINKKNDIYSEEYEILEEAIKTIQTPGFESNNVKKQFEDLTSSYKKLLLQSERLVSISDRQQKHMYKLQNDLKNTLDNIGQGILTVNEMLIVNKGCSAECMRIFGQKVEGKKFTSLIKPYNHAEKLILLESILNKDFFEWDALKKKVMAMLLPDELYIGERVYGVEYKPITFELDEVENLFMIVLTDVTEKRVMERKLEEEKVIFKAVTRIVADMKYFSVCVREYKSFYEEKLPKLLCDKTGITFDTINIIFREVHTLKGNFAAFEIPWIVDFLESVEQSLLVIREGINFMRYEEILLILKGYDFKGSIDDLLTRLRNLLGSKWDFSSDFAIVGIEKIKALEAEAGELSPSLARKIKELRYSKFTDLLAAYPQYTIHLAERLGKTVQPFTIKCTEDIYVDSEKYYEFSRALVNVFRNCVDHGIETPEERALTGKPIEGEIGCIIEKDQKDYIVIIHDDGRGIDIEKLKCEACNIARTEENRAEAIAEEEVLKLIFSDGVSTADKSSHISGRGVGLAAVKYEVELLGGKVEVSSKPGKGTIFIFRIPCD